MAEEEKRRHRIALVEDSDEDVFLIQEASRKFSNEIHFVRFTTAESAIAGLTNPGSLPLDGIMLDLNLPRGSGLEVLNAIRRSDGLRSSRVVVLTSSGSARDRAAAEAKAQIRAGRQGGGRSGKAADQVGECQAG